MRVRMMGTRITWIFIAALLWAGNAMAGPSKKQLKLTIENTSTTYSDETTVYLDNGTSPAYSFAEDAKKVFTTAYAVPQVFSLTADSISCLINGYGPLSQSVQVAMGVKTDTTGNYNIALNQLDNFDATSMILLEDKTTGTLHNLRSSAYNFNLTSPGMLANRFVLHVTFPTLITTVEANCSNSGGSINLVQDTALAWTSCSAYDSVGNLMGTYPNATGSFSFNNLGEGTYSVVFMYGTYQVVKTVTVDGNQIIAGITASHSSAAVGQAINFYALAPNGVYFSWEFGDGTIITGVANPTMAYYTPGTYTVILRSTNAYGCEDIATIVITIGTGTGIAGSPTLNAQVYSSGKQIFVQATTNSLYHYTVNNILGSTVAQGMANNPNTTIALPYAANGVYIVTLQQGNVRYSKKVVLGN